MADAGSADTMCGGPIHYSNSVNAAANWFWASRHVSISTCSQHPEETQIHWRTAITAREAEWSGPHLPARYSRNRTVLRSN